MVKNNHKIFESSRCGKNGLVNIINITNGTEYRIIEGGNTMKLKKVLAALLVCMMVLPMAACAEGFSGTITGITSNDVILNNIQTVMGDFLAANPDLKLDFQRSTVEDLDSKINLAHVSGQGYDYISVNNSSVKQFVAAGVLEPLDPYLEAAGIDLSEYYSESLLEVGKVDGVLYAIPQDPDCRVMIYNKKVLDAAGFEAPKNQEDILKICEALCHDGVYAFARQFSSLGTVYNEGSFIIANGANICREVDGKIVGTCNTPEMIKSMQFWVDMIPYMPQDMNYDETQVHQMFVDGKLLFNIYGPWMINDTTTALSNLEYGVDYALIPVPGDVPNSSIAGGFWVGIGSGSKNKDATWATIQEMLSPEMICKMQFAMPGDGRCYDMAPYNTEIYQPFKQALTGAQPPMPYSTNFNKVCDIFYDYFNRVVVGGEDIVEMMTLCDADINALFAE